MGSRRTTRIAENQSMFRMVDERVTSWPERQAAPPAERLMFYCECADTKCFEHVFLTAEEYEAIRADSTRFVVVAGHVFPEAERVVADVTATRWCRRTTTSVASLKPRTRGVARTPDPEGSRRPRRQCGAWWYRCTTA